MVAEMRCVTSIYRLELGSGDFERWYLGSSVVGVPKSYRCTIIIKEILCENLFTIVGMVS